MPYTNFHGVNQDWIIKTTKHLVEEWYADGDNATISWSGNVNTDGDAVVITGDCVCTITIL